MGADADNGHAQNFGQWGDQAVVKNADPGWWLLSSSIGQVVVRRQCSVGFIAFEDPLYSGQMLLYRRELCVSGSRRLDIPVGIQHRLQVSLRYCENSR